MWEVWLDHSANFAAGAADKLTRGATDRLREAMGINDEVDHDSMAYASGEVAGVAIEAGTMATGVGAVRTAGIRVVVGTALKGAAVSTGAGIGVELGVNAAVEAGFVSEGGGQVIKDAVTVARELAPVAGKAKAKFKTRRRPRAHRTQFNGKKPGPKTDRSAPHNLEISRQGDLIEAKGGRVIAGGGRAPEKLIPTPGGAKGGRRPDILYIDEKGVLRGRNVGKTRLSDGLPVKREMDALVDLNQHGGLPTDFVPYDRY